MGTSKGVKLQAQNVKKIFAESFSEKKIVAIEDISLEVHDNELCVIIGPSGCGKSTFLYMVAGFEKPTEGRLLFEGRPISGPSPNVGIVFQEFVLFPWKTVMGNVMFGLEARGIKKDEAKKIASKYIDLVGLREFLDNYPHTLSGGMKQRVAIARVLAYDPKLLLMDEPFGSLDAQTRRIMIDEFSRIHEKFKKTTVFVTHSVDEALKLADKIVVLSARPSKVLRVFAIESKRPRDIDEPEFLNMKREILSLLEEEVKKHIKQNTG